MTPDPTASHASWAQTPERSNMLMLRVMTWISLRLGRRVARSVVHLIAAYFLLFAPASRRASSHYLGRALGRPARWRDLYQHFFTFAATIHDRVYLVNRRFDLFEFEVHGEDTLRRLLADGKGLFLIGAHLGSFEVIRAIGWKHSDLRVAMLMHEDNAQKINAMLAAINPEAVKDIIGLGHIDSMLKVRERLDDGCVVGMLADRTPGDDTLNPVQFLGVEARLPVGPFRMAALLRRPVVFMTGLYLGGNRYAIHFEPLADFSDVARGQRGAAVEAAIARYAALLDHYCRKAPYNWFNFFDFWQSAPAATPPSS
ncbi:lipid A biosynthesis acyltransferase [Sulfuricella denitrificans skB26]|uniref:Lipid A biosynthesis acyltransferase n=1 Tax=Sulfuricella denitrificans (strain DSM 22764 / NBRC 105220 / skB26) TaxID=1163617 RepID=S6ANU3_SULDS|nr:acyl-CoA synthetase [Sulfuricella denitrificans]BAN36564.1 lipid A biosynthesis acyltransferase [Sulfuricella denitrificans skB26]